MSFIACVASSSKKAGRVGRPEGLRSSEAAAVVGSGEVPGQLDRQCDRRHHNFCRNSENWKMNEIWTTFA